MTADVATDDELRLVETRAYPAPAAFAAQANVTAGAYGEAAADPLAFWERAARRLDWTTPWHTALDWQPPAASRGAANRAAP